MNLDQFIESAGLKMSAKPEAENPHNRDWRDANHWRCVVSSSAHRGRLTIHFSQGYAHGGAVPELASVLQCLASDSASYANAQSFEDWCSEYGYDTDSRKAERIYRTVENQAQKLRAFLGESGYETLLWRTNDEANTA